MFYFLQNIFIEGQKSTSAFWLYKQLEQLSVEERERERVRKREREIERETNYTKKISLGRSKIQSTFPLKVKNTKLPFLRRSKTQKCISLESQ